MYHKEHIALPRRSLNSQTREGPALGQDLQIGVRRHMVPGSAPAGPAVNAQDLAITPLPLCPVSYHGQNPALLDCDQEETPEAALAQGG